jgi:glyoxylase-like metal-dependent hydrolase (beta-lactamase superfamily II)
MLDHVCLVGSGTMGFDWTHRADGNVYLLDGGDACALVDSGTGESVEAIMEHVASAGVSPERVTHLFLTHIHADHAGGAAGLREATGARVAVHAEAAGVLEQGDEAGIDLDRAKKAGFYPKDFRFTPCTADLKLRDGDTIDVGALKVRAMFGPGHSAFDVFYFVEVPGGHVSLFTGDALFTGGRISMIHTRDFDLKKLAATLERVEKERADSLFPGHLQPALRRAREHVRKAMACFERMRVPPSVV